jgi:Tol biopolymer transport system component
MDKKRLACMAGLIGVTLFFSCKKEHTTNPQITISTLYPDKYLLFDADQAFNNGLSSVPSPYTAIYYANLDGLTITRITPNDPGYYCYRPSWAPNGQYVLYIRGDAADTDRRLCVIDINGGHFQSITKGDEVDYGMFSPDGLSIAYAKSLVHFIPFKYDIYICHFDGTSERRVTTFADFNGAVANVHWGSDNKIYFEATSDRDHAGVYSVNPDGSNLKYIMSDVDFMGISPDAKHLLYSLGDGLYTCDLDGTNIKTIINYANSNLNYFTGASWSADGEQIFLSNADYPAHLGIYSVNTSGSGLKQILSGYYEFPTVH